MRYLKAAVIALAAGGLVFLLIINLESLSQPLVINLDLPWYPLGALTMPIWLALLAAVLIAFLFALVLEVGAWYEYTRTIRLQRKQIRLLQAVLGRQDQPRQPAGAAPK